MGSTSKKTAEPAASRRGNTAELGQNGDPSEGHAQGVLAQTLIHQIIPRLVSAHTESPATDPAGDKAQLDGQDVLDFTMLVLQADDVRLQQEVAAMLASGIAARTILLDLLVPVARHMGRLWEHDLCDFHDVTLAVGRLQRLLRMCGGPVPDLLADAPGGRILLGAPSGEQHTFGLSVVAEFFHQAGWDVATSYLANDRSPLSLVKEQWFDVVGLSLGGDTRMAEFSKLIVDIRRVSLNRHVSIIAGGPMFVLHPEYASQYAVDAVITDASRAPAIAEQLLMKRKALAV